MQPAWSGPMPDQATLIIRIQNIRIVKGSIQVALFQDAASFESKEGSIRGQILPISNLQNQELRWTGLEYGTYALALYHDVNNNGKLDRNLWGIPTEPYGFAKKEPSKWRAPTFEEAAFQLDDPQQIITVPLESWKNR